METGHKLSYNKAASNAYPLKLKTIMEEQCLKCHQLLNADESSLQYRDTSSYICPGETGLYGYTKNMEKVTMMTTANAMADCIIRPLIIGTAIQPRCMKSAVSQKHLSVTLVQKLIGLLLIYL